MPPEKAGEKDSVAREEFEQFLHVMTHELRNRLNGIALEAADLAEQAGKDSARLQQQVRSCSAFLKDLRETLAPDDPKLRKMTVADFMARLQERKAHGENP